MSRADPSSRLNSPRPFMSILLRRFILPTLGLILAAVGGAAAAAPKILHVGNMIDPQELDPQLITGLPEFRICIALLEGLVGLDADGKITPGVAQNWDISADGLVYTFHLRPEARWSNGRALTATDF